MGRWVMCEGQSGVKGTVRYRKVEKSKICLFIKH
jgi:hypothetical protein